MKLPVYLELLETAEGALAASFRVVGEGHADDADVFHTCSTLAKQCEQHAASLAPVLARYGRAGAAERDPGPEGVPAARSGSLGLLRDLHDVFVLASLVEMTWTLVQQAGQALRDEELLTTVSGSLMETEVQLAWLRTRMKVAAPQTLVAS